ncbi:MAG TPA: hypothetical protein VGB39_03810 [Sphingomicrobium sp.]
MASPTGKLQRNFGAYAMMEGANVVLVPALALWFGWPRSGSEIWAMAISIFAVSGLLVVGTLFWHGIDLRLKGKGGSAAGRAVKFADAAQRPMAIATAASVVGAVAAFAINGPSNAAIAAALLSLLAVLEYVNYYHRQLQVFDNAADMRRLLSTRQLKRAHLARELAAYRKTLKASAATR